MVRTQEKLPPARVLKDKKQNLMERFIADGAPGFLKAYAGLLDAYFRESFEQSQVGPRMCLAKNPYAVVALGGYGRNEMCLGSDVDLLLLFETRIPDMAPDLVREIVYPLWDAGLDVGHATRTILDCESLGAKDFEVLTSLLDARFVCGASSLYSSLMERMRARVVDKNRKKILSWLAATSETRHARFGDASFLLEPNIKEGLGGLRDYHVMLWIASVVKGAREPRDLERLGFLMRGEYDELSRALDFVWTTRNHLHRITGRKSDALYFEHQIPLAGFMGFSGKDELEAVERFLGALHAQMESIKRLHQAMVFSAAPAPSGRFRIIRAKTRVPGLTVEGDAISFISPVAAMADTRLMVKIFEESARARLPLSVEARRTVKAFLHLIDGDFRSDPEAVKSFERVLASPSPGFHVLEDMMGTGFLTAFIPEMGPILDRIQYNQYHVYPVARHSLRTVGFLAGLSGQEGRKFGLEARLYEEIASKKALLWAALLHDVGKGFSATDHAAVGAEIAGKILERLGHGKKTTELIRFLVAEHLFLVKTATRRDLNDEQTALSCARRMGDASRLKMLYLLTVADSVATGPKAWNDWTASLLKDLFFKALHILEHGDMATKRAVSAAEKKKKLVAQAMMGEMQAAEAGKLIEFLPSRYLDGTPAEDIVRHLALVREMGGGTLLRAGPGPEENYRAVTVCAKDRHGLFATIAGVFTLHNIDILDAHIYTWRNHVAVDTFVVRPLFDLFDEAGKWAQVEKDFKSALAGDLDLEAAVAKSLRAKKPLKAPTAPWPERVQMDNETSGFFNIVEVLANDRPGLLYTITQALFKCRMDVSVAKIATRMDQVMDIFYVRDFDGQKVIDYGELERIGAYLEGTLAAYQPYAK